MNGIPRAARPSTGPFQAVSVLLLLLCRCGGAQQSQAPASAAPTQPAKSLVEEAPAQPGGPSGGVQLAPPPAAPPPPPVVPEDARDERKTERISARADLDRAQRELDVAASDCESACRALASMERATSHLCSLAEEPGDQRRCDDAKVRLTSAKGRVRAACGACR